MSAMLRRTVGEWILGGSVLYSLMDLSGWLRPHLLRLSVHGGFERRLAVVLGSLSLKAVLLFVGGVLAFWPVRTAQTESRG